MGGSNKTLDSGSDRVFGKSSTLDGHQELLNKQAEKK